MRETDFLKSNELDKLLFCFFTSIASYFKKFTSICEKDEKENSSLMRLLKSFFFIFFFYSSIFGIWYNGIYNIWYPRKVIQSVLITSFVRSLYFPLVSCSISPILKVGEVIIYEKFSIALAAGVQNKPINAVSPLGIKSN